MPPRGLVEYLFSGLLVSAVLFVILGLAYACHEDEIQFPPKSAVITRVDVTVVPPDGAASVHGAVVDGGVGYILAGPLGLIVGASAGSSDGEREISWRAVAVDRKGVQYSFSRPSNCEIPAVGDKVLIHHQIDSENWYVGGYTQCN